MLDASDNRLVPGSDVGDALGVAHQPVVPIPQTENLGGVGVEPTQQNGEVIGLCPRINQEDAIEARPQLLAQHLGVLALEWLHVDRRGMGQGLHLLLHDLADPRV